MKLKVPFDFVYFLRNVKHVLICENWNFPFTFLYKALTFLIFLMAVKAKSPGRSASNAKCSCKYNMWLLTDHTLLLLLWYFFQFCGTILGMLLYLKLGYSWLAVMLCILQFYSLVYVIISFMRGCGFAAQSILGVTISIQPAQPI